MAHLADDRKAVDVVDVVTAEQVVVLVLLALVDERFSVGEPILLVDLGRALDDDVKEAMTMQVKMDHEGELQ